MLTGASRAPFVYFAAVLQPATRLVIGRSSLCCPASGLPSLHFQVGCCSCKLPCASFGPAWLRSPRPGPSPPCACPHSHLYIHRHTHTHTPSLLESPSYRVRWHLFACRKPRTECEVVSFPHIPHSLVRSLVGGASLHLLFLAICAVKSSPGLRCLATGLSLPVILDNFSVTYVPCPLRCSQSTLSFFVCRVDSFLTTECHLKFASTPSQGKANF